MDLAFIKDMFLPLIVVACLVVGYCIKHITWLEKISNEYIPLILATLGAVLACVEYGTSLEIIVCGALSGLASTGLHQAFKNLIEKREE